VLPGAGAVRSSWYFRGRKVVLVFFLGSNAATVRSTGRALVRETGGVGAGASRGREQRPVPTCEDVSLLGGGVRHVPLGRRAGRRRSPTLPRRRRLPRFSDRRRGRYPARYVGRSPSTTRKRIVPGASLERTPTVRIRLTYSRMSPKREVSVAGKMGSRRTAGFPIRARYPVTDGRIMVRRGTAHWHALTPDDKGSYQNGTWSTLADMSFWRRYYASGAQRRACFPLRRRAERPTATIQQGGDLRPADRQVGPIHLPPCPRWAMPRLCAAGRAVMIGALLSGLLIYDPTTDTWSTTFGQPGRTNEESWSSARRDCLTVQCFPPIGVRSTVIATGKWQDEGLYRSRSSTPS